MWWSALQRFKFWRLGEGWQLGEDMGLVALGGCSSPECAQDESCYWA